MSLVPREEPKEILSFAVSLGIENVSHLKKSDIVREIVKCSEVFPALLASGVLEVVQDGFGFLRSAAANYLPNGDDIYVAPHQIKQWKLRTGDTIEGTVSLPKKNEQYLGLEEIITVNGDGPTLKYTTPFEKLTPIFPERKIRLEPELTTPENQKRSLSLRLLELICPMGHGQRSLIVAPPRTGKTILLQSIAQAITENHPDAYLIILLIDERPEEVTDMKRSVKAGEIISSTFDEPASRHVQVAEMVLEKGKRLVEKKKDVVILLDSITRLSRAYNTVVPSSGKVLTGGVDANALQKPKRFFGAARNFEEGGSLTIIATALVDTGSRMDDVIFEEFKGTGNQEIILDRKVADKRIFPALDIARSGTRREELLINPQDLSKIWVLRRVLSAMGQGESIEFLIEKLKLTKNNADFFYSMGQN
jgi:transcription termination factor Rho